MLEPLITSKCVINSRCKIEYCLCTPKAWICWTRCFYLIKSVNECSNGIRVYNIISALECGYRTREYRPNRSSSSLDTPGAKSYPLTASSQCRGYELKAADDFIGAH